LKLIQLVWVLSRNSEQEQKHIPTTGPHILLMGKTSVIIRTQALQQPSAEACREISMCFSLLVVD